MRINDEFRDDEPEKKPDNYGDKFKVIKAYTDMPKRYQAIHREFFKNAMKMINFDRPPTENLIAAVKHTAFLSVQIASLQEEIKQLYAVLEHFAKSLDEIAEGKE